MPTDRQPEFDALSDAAFDSQGDATANTHYHVKKWTRNKHAIMFQLSNKTVQVIFFDKTEAVLSSRSHLVTYVDKKGQVQAYPLTNVLDVPSAELAKRLRYTKDRTSANHIACLKTSWSIFLVLDFHLDFLACSRPGCTDMYLNPRI
eukprot:s2525_g12.t1